MTMPEEKKRDTGTNAGQGQAEAAQAQVGEKVLDVESLRKALEDEKARAESYLAGWQRAQADFANFKRRAEQEKNDTVTFANAMLVSSLLPVLDDMERAFDAVSPKLAGLSWVDGMKLIYRKLLAILEAQGLSEIKTVGEGFDPRLHEAIMYTDGEEGKVVEEVQKGYKFRDRVVRPAMVKVGRGVASKPEPEKKEGTPEGRGSPEAQRGQP